MNTTNIDQLIGTISFRDGALSNLFIPMQQVFELEWEHIWKKYWLFAGTTAEIPKPGDYFTYQVTRRFHYYHTGK